MLSNSERHLVVVRHGESEGDVRRAAHKNGARYSLNKNPADEEQTPRGDRQSAAAGRWITRFVLEQYKLGGFDLYASSPLIRVRQSAQSLGITGDWQEEPLLRDRNRGKIQGLPSRRHRELYPNSFEQMTKQPFMWRPPEGEIMLEVSGRVKQFANKTGHLATILAVTHRDWMWAAHLPLDGLSIEETQLLNTDQIGNAQIFHYTNVNPGSGRTDGPELYWKRTVRPWIDEKTLEAASHTWLKITPQQPSP